MSMFAKIMVVVNLILAVIFLAAAGTLHGAAENWKAKEGATATRLNGEIANLKGQVTGKEGEVNAAREAQRASEARSAAAEAVQRNLNEGNAALMAENGRLKAENERHLASAGDHAKTIADLNGRNAALSDQMATAVAERRAAQDENATLKENLQRETSRADDAEKSVAAAEMNNKSISEKLDATTTELTIYKKSYPHLPGTVMKAVSGVVSAASAKDDVYVITCGTKDGVEIGYEFTVYRGNEYVSTIVIDVVYPTYAAGRTKTGMKKSDVKPGDSVTTKL